jgi:hypothetical protein
MHTIFLLKNLEGGDHSEGLTVGGKIILELVLGK